MGTGPAHPLQETGSAAATGAPRASIAASAICAGRPRLLRSPRGGARRLLILERPAELLGARSARHHVGSRSVGALAVGARVRASSGPRPRRRSCSISCSPSGGTSNRPGKNAFAGGWRRDDSVRCYRDNPLMWQRPDLLAQATEQLEEAIAGSTRVEQQDHACRCCRQMTYCAHERDDRRSEVASGSICGRPSPSAIRASKSLALRAAPALTGATLRSCSRKSAASLRSVCSLPRASRSHEQDVAVSLEPRRAAAAPGPGARHRGQRRCRRQAVVDLESACTNSTEHLVHCGEVLLESFDQASWAASDQPAHRHRGCAARTDRRSIPSPRSPPAVPGTMPYSSRASPFCG